MQYRYMGPQWAKSLRDLPGHRNIQQSDRQGHLAAIIAAARDSGVNFINTADVYNKGESERVVGRAIAAERNSWVLATKAGNPMGEGLIQGGMSRKWIREAAHASLTRLGTDYIDILYMHKADFNAPLEEMVLAFADLIREGKIGYLAYPISKPGGWQQNGTVWPIRPAWLGRSLPQPLYRHPVEMVEGKMRNSAFCCVFSGHRHSLLQSAGARHSDRQVSPGSGTPMRAAARTRRPAHVEGGMAARVGCRLRASWRRTPNRPDVNPRILPRHG